MLALFRCESIGDDLTNNEGSRSGKLTLGLDFIIWSTFDPEACSVFETALVFEFPKDLSLFLTPKPEMGDCLWKREGKRVGAGVKAAEA